MCAFGGSGNMPQQAPRFARRGFSLCAKQGLGNSVLQGMHVGIAQPEMMADFVHDDVRDKMVESLPAFTPFVEDWTAIEVDGWRRVAGLCGFADGATRIKAGQVERTFDLHFSQNAVLGKIFDD